MQVLKVNRTRNILGSAIAMLCLSAGAVFGADAPLASDQSINMVDPTPVSQQKPSVDGWNYKAGVVSGVIGGLNKNMFFGFIVAPLPLIYILRG